MKINNAWQQHWQNSSGAANQAIIPIRDSIFKELKEVSGSKILELASGAGEFSIALAEANKGSEFVATDLFAQYRESPLSNLTLISGVDCSCLPDHLVEFDRVVSVFGVEYADLYKVIEQLPARLQRDGKFQFICHAEQSLIYNNTKRYQTSLELIQAANILDTTLEYIQSKSKSSEQKLQAIAGNFVGHSLYVDQVGNPLSDQLRFLDAILLNLNKLEVAELIPVLDKAKQDIAHAHQRQSEMLDAALSENEIKALLASEQAASFDTQFKAIGNHDGLLGWYVEGVLIEN